MDCVNQACIRVFGGDADKCQGEQDCQDVVVMIDTDKDEVDLTIEDHIKPSGDGRKGLPTLPPDQLKRAKIALGEGENVSIGSADALVKMVTFLDLSCGMCKHWLRDTWPQIKTRYVKLNKVQVIFRNFPLGLSQKSIEKAMAAECAAKQGQYLEFIDWMYAIKEDQSKTMSQYASILKDPNAFLSCLEHQDPYHQIMEDVQAGNELGVKGTPFFYINGTELRGAQPFQEFAKVIEQELRKSRNAEKS
ncbi:MAG: thioredoxin domain-containing protein [Candidatus Omnitrophica bacterium]|nr:thioredoxin domain-containing protein [Candidatus Omnitrophota bacterium]